MVIPFTNYRSLLAKYLKPQRGRVIGLAIALLSGIALQIINPLILSYFIDTAVKGGSRQTLLVTAAGFAAIALLAQAFSVMATYWGEVVAWTATNELRIDLTAHCLALDLSFHKTYTPGELLERVDGDVSALSRFFSQLIIHLLGNGLLLTGILAVLWFKNRLAGLCLTLFAAIALGILLSLRSMAIAPWTEYRQIGAEFYGTLGEQIAGREDLRANGASGYVMRRFYAILQRWLPAYQNARFSSTVLWFSSVGLFAVGNAIALALSAYLWNQKAITIGTAYTIFFYANSISQPIERIREEMEQLQQTEASIYRVRDLLSVKSQILDRGDLSLPTGALSVSFDRVWFSYEGIDREKSELNINSSPLPAATLQNLSFYLPAGQVLGILGRTGSGKSTIARLLLRLYDIQSGAISLGETAIDRVSLSALRRRVGLVTQDVQLFQASVRDNLTFFDPSVREAEIQEILTVLGLESWSRSLPDGLQTELGSDSVGLSAGQAQLLALVRVFLKNPGLVILDEASSRLDPQTERLLENAIDRLLKNRTGIVIAHRLQTLERCDRILILDRGKVVEYGDRLTLADRPESRYAKLLAKNRLEG